jgi:hypothetical protein
MLRNQSRRPPPRVFRKSVMRQSKNSNSNTNSSSKTSTNAPKLPEIQLHETLQMLGQSILDLESSLQILANRHSQLSDKVLALEYRLDDRNAGYLSGAESESAESISETTSKLSVLRSPQNGKLDYDTEDLPNSAE